MSWYATYTWVARAAHVLHIENLTAGYGGAPVIRDLNLEVPAADVLGVLGRNGSGKSTLLRAIVSIAPDVSGSVRLDGTELAGLPPHRIARAGVAYVPQGRGIFPRLTVLDNLMTGTRARRAGDRAIDPRVYDYFPILRERASQYGGTMSGGEQQMLAVARALVARPKLMLMDEPSDGVAPKVVEMLAELLPGIAREMGLAIVLVEQNVDLVLAVSKRCSVMARGEIVKSGFPDEFRDSETLRQYLAI